MKNIMQLKAIINDMAKRFETAPQIVMQVYMMERLLERISVSPYNKHFILKGGFLISSMIGLHTRSTMDLDATIRGIALTEENLTHIFDEICSINMPDDINFTLSRVSRIRESSTYHGYRITFIALLSPIRQIVKLDLTTGDRLTPEAIAYSHKLLLDGREIPILAYNTETLLAEKLETILSRAQANTRARDFYDVYILALLKSQHIDMKILKKALHETCQLRGTLVQLSDYASTLQGIMSSPYMNRLWEAYRTDFHYAAAIDFSEVCRASLHLLQAIDTYSD